MPLQRGALPPPTVGPLNVYMRTGTATSTIWTNVKFSVPTLHAESRPLSVHSFHQPRRTTAQPQKLIPTIKAGGGHAWRIMAGKLRSLDHRVVNTSHLVLIFTARIRSSRRSGRGRGASPSP